MSKYRLLLSGTVIGLAAFFSTGFALAGGGPVEFTLEPSGKVLNPGEQYTVNARVHTDGPWPTYCKNCLINLAFADSQGSDYIAQNSDRTDENGTIYAKVISKVPGKRMIIVKDRIITRPDGVQITANSYVYLNYSGDAPRPTSPSFPEGGIYLKIGDQRYIDGPKRIVTFSWNQVKNAVKYNVYVRQAGSKDYGAAILGTGNSSGETVINAFIDYDAKVEACSEPTSCVSSPEVFIKAMEERPMNRGTEPAGSRRTGY